MIKCISLFWVAIVTYCGCALSLHSECGICGGWQWEKNDDRHDFSLQISLQDGFVVGKHCYVFDYGNKIDCASDKQDVSFKIENSGLDSIRVNIRSHYSGQQGIAVVKLKAGKLHWKLVKAPAGEYYLPKEALMIRSNTK